MVKAAPSTDDTEFLPAADDFAIMERHATAAARLMSALANPHRLMILCALAQGEMGVGELNRRIPLSQSALSQHLALLREQGVVQCRRQSQSVLYQVAPGPAVALVGVLHQHFCGNDAMSPGHSPS
jgi:DNA-binding transcriptional ArsR family regulator